MRRSHRVACQRPAAAIGAAGFVAVMMLVGATSAVFAPKAIVIIDRPGDPQGPK